MTAMYFKMTTISSISGNSYLKKQSYDSILFCLALIKKYTVEFQVKTADASWRETRKMLRKDHRWDMAELLERDEKEKIFEEHIENLYKKNKEMFHKLLDETTEVWIFLRFFSLNVDLQVFCIQNSVSLFVKLPNVKKTCKLYSR